MARPWGIRVRFRAWWPDERRWRAQDDRSHRRGGGATFPSPSTHASSRMRLCAGEPRSRYPRSATLVGTQEHPAHGAVHRTESDALQELLEGVTGFDQLLTGGLNDSSA